MIVDKILNDIEAQEKLASQAAPDPAKAAENQLSAALSENLQKVASQAVPAAGSPVQDLFKLAEDMVSSEMEREVKQAALCGRAFAHSAIEEFRAYDTAAKTAAAQAIGNTPLMGQAVKEAAKDSDLMKAAELGYANAQQRVAGFATKEAQMEMKLASVNIDDNLLEKVAQAGYSQTCEKVAAEQHQAGYTAAMTEVRDRAAEEFIKGAMEVQKMVEISVSQQG